MDTVFLIDLYNPFADRTGVRETFYLNGRQWAIREVALDWGIPILPPHITEEEPDPKTFFLYNTYEEAIAFKNELLRLNR